MRESSRINASLSGFTSGSNGSLDFFSASDGAVDLFAPSNLTFGDFSQVGGGFDIKPSIIVKREASKLDAFPRSELTDGVDLQDHSTVIQNAVSGEPVSEFRSAFEENALVNQVMKLKQSKICFRMIFEQVYFLSVWCSGSSRLVIFHTEL